MALNYPINLGSYGLGALFFLLLLFCFTVHHLRVMCFIIAAIFASALVTSFAQINHNQLITSLSGDEAIYEGVIEEVWLRPDGSKQIAAALKKSDDKNQRVLRVTVSLHEAATALKPKALMTLRIQAKLLPYKKPLSPVHFDAFRYGLTHRLHAHASISDARFIMLGPQANDSGVSHLRQLLKDRIFASTTPHQASLLLALIVGNTSFFTEEQKLIYQYIGAQHLLAVSGLQIAIIGYLCFMLFLPLCTLLLPLRHIHMSHIFASLITLIVIWFFVALCNWPKSAIRAALMASILIFPKLLGRKQDSFDAFFLSAWIILLTDPLSLLDIGFLLSYGAVFGLIVMHHYGNPLLSKVNEHSSFSKAVLSSFLSSLGAFIFTLPTVIYYFEQIAPLGTLANFLLVPLASLLQIPAILCGVFGAWLNSSSLIELGAFFASIIEILASLLSDAFGNIMHISKDKIVVIIIAVCGSFMLMLGFLHSNRIALILGALTLPLLLNAFMPRSEQALIVRVLAVGQGDAALFSMPSDHHMLIDAGGQAFGSYDPGKSVVIPTLKRLGIKKLDILVISHPDPDHILGAFYVLDAVPVEEIWHSGFKAGHPLTERLCAKAKELDIPIKKIGDLPKSLVLGGATIEVLAPAQVNESMSANNNSLVLRIIHDGIALLWPGDVEKEGEKLLLGMAKNIEATILKAPHHGSKTSSTSEFIDAVNPRYVIYSTGRNNRFDFPHNEVKNRYKERQVKSFNTAVDGEITIRIHKQHLSLSGHSSHPSHFPTSYTNALKAHSTVP